VVQVNALTVKVWPASRIMEAGKVTIWLAMESARTPLPGAPLSTRYSRQSTEGGTHDGRLVGGGARDDDPDVDARRTRGFIQFRPSSRRNTLRPTFLWIVLI
jgi:hypothetical protein